MIRLSYTHAGKFEREGGRGEEWENETCFIETLYNHKLPTVVTMGGGYAPDIDVIVQGHSVVFGVVRDVFG